MRAWWAWTYLDLLNKVDRHVAEVVREGRGGDKRVDVRVGHCVNIEGERAHACPDHTLMQGSKAGEAGSGAGKAEGARVMT